MAESMNDKCITKMEHRLLTEAESTDCGAVGSLFALTKGQNPLTVRVVELPVVGD